MKTYDRVVVGLTTIPSRVQHLVPVVAALRDQTRVPDAIYITVPKTSAKENDVPYPIGEISKMLKKAAGKLGRVLVLDADYGPLTKLVGMFRHEKSPKTLIITVDDDQIYSNTFIETMLDGAERHPGAAVCLCGHLLGKSPFVWGFRCSRHDDNTAVRALYLKPDSRVTVVSGWCGCAYPRRALGDDLPEVLEKYRVGSGKLPLLNRHDDLYISSWLFLRGVKKYVIAYKGKHCDEEMDHALQNALSSGDGSRTPVTMAKHTKEWWDFSRRLQGMGLLESDVVPWNKSMFFLSCVAGATALTAIAAVCAIILVKKLRK
jgi:hypothetical protein